MLAPSLDAFRALCKLAVPASIQKYQKWYEEDHPRDAFGKWTSGFSSGAFAADDAKDDGPPDTPSAPKDGNESEPGWMGSTPQQGISLEHPGLNAVTGAPNSGYLDHTHAFKNPTNPDAALMGAAQLSQHINNGDFEAARKLIHDNPEILFAFRKQHHGSVKNAKKAAAFLNATTDATWVQHGTFVNKPKMQPPKEQLPQPEAPPLPPVPKPVGAPKLIDFDPKKKLISGTLGAMQAQDAAEAIHAALSKGNVESARKIAFANPDALTALYTMKQGSVIEAKSAAAFLHLITGKTFAQHGTHVNMPKGAIPASSWAHPGFKGTGAPGGDPDAAPGAAALTGNTTPPKVAVGDYLEGPMGLPDGYEASVQAQKIVDAINGGSYEQAAGLLAEKPSATAYLVDAAGVDPATMAWFLSQHTDHAFQPHPNDDTGDTMLVGSFQGDAGGIDTGNTSPSGPVAVKQYLGGVDTLSEDSMEAADGAANDILFMLANDDETGAGNALKEHPEATAFLVGYGGSMDPEKLATFMSDHTDHDFIAKPWGALIATPKGGFTAAAQGAPVGVPGKPASIIPPPGVMPPPSAAQQAKAPPPVAPAAWAPVEATALSGVPKVGGTNEGGFYTLADGTKGYAKFYKNPEQMQTEALANQFYRTLGINAPDSKLYTINGKQCIFSPLIENAKQFSKAGAESTQALQSHPQVMSGFAADAILANHDVVGLDHDNFMFGNADGQAHRMDNGGSLKYRAQGMLKGPDYTPDAVPELDSMRDPKHGAGKIFSGLSDKQVVQQVAQLAQKMTPDKVAELAKNAGFSGAGLTEHTEMLNGRINAALKWAGQHVPPQSPELEALMAIAQQKHEAATAKPDAVSPAVPDAPLGDKLLEGIGTLNTDHKPTLNADTAIKLPLSPGITKILTNATSSAVSTHNEHDFAAQVTTDEKMLAAAAQKQWHESWPAEQTAKLLEHLTGKPHLVVKDGHAFKVADGAPAPVIPKAHADADSLAVSKAAVGQNALTQSADAAIKDWKQKGASSTSAAKLSVKDLGSILSATYGNPVVATRAAGLLMHKTGKDVAVTFDASSGEYGLEIDHNKVAPEPAWPGQHSGYPDPATYEHTNQTMAGMSDGMTPEGVQNVLNKHQSEGNHVAAAWGKAWAQANGLLGDSGESSPGATPEQQQQLDDASLASQINYTDIPVSPGIADPILNSVKIYAQGDPDVLTALIKNSLDASSGGVTLAAIAQGSYQNTTIASNIVLALKDNGLKASLTGDYSTGYKINIEGGIHPNHLAEAKAKLPGIHKLPKPNLPPTSGPLFATLPQGVAPLGISSAKNIKASANSVAKAGPGVNLAVAKGIAKSVEDNPAKMHYLATVPQTKLTANRFAALINNHGEKYQAFVVKKPGHSGMTQYVLHIKPKAGATGATPQYGVKSPTTAGVTYKPAPPKVSAFDATFKEKYGMGPLTSDSPLSLKLSTPGSLPPGIGPNDLVLSGKTQQIKKISELKAAGLDASADFLQAGFDKENKEPAHAKAHTEHHFIGSVQNYPSPFLRPHEIMDQITNGITNKDGTKGKTPLMPPKVTPSMLHAAPGAEQAACLNELGLQGKDVPFAWLKEFYSNRAQAKAGGLSTFNTQHPGFKDPTAYGQHSPTKVSTSNNFSSSTMISVPKSNGRTQAHETSAVPQRTEPIKVGNTSYDATHLPIPPGPVSIGVIRQRAKSKCDAVFQPLLNQQLQDIAAGKVDLEKSPFDSLSGNGVDPRSAHAHKLAATLFPPLLAAARACMPSEGVLRACSSKISDDALGRDISKGTFDSLCSQMGVDPYAVEQVRNAHQSWYGNAQGEAPKMLKVASNMLRGRDPAENVFIGKGGAEADQAASKLATQLSPDFMKAYLIHKAITQAAMERIVDADGRIAFQRGIQADVSSAMLGKTHNKYSHFTAGAALNQGMAGQKFQAHEATLAGYSLKYLSQFSGGGSLHRYVRPEAVWHSFRYSPTHGTGNSFEGELEHFLTSEGGGEEFQLAPSVPKVKSAVITPGSSGGSDSSNVNPYVKAQHGPNNMTADDGFTPLQKSVKKSPENAAPPFDDLIKALDAAKSVLKPTMHDYGLPVPKTAEDWNRWVPHDWAPSQAHIDAYVAAHTDADGTMHLNFHRDDGMREAHSSPEIRQAARDGTLATSTSSALFV